MLAHFSRVCSAFPKRGVSLAVGHSPMQDAAFYELSSMVEVCFQLFSSLRRETLPCSSSIYRQLSLVGFCKSPPSELATCSAESARAELVLFEISLLYMCSRLSAILVRFVYLDTRKTDNGRSEVLVM